MPIKVTKYATVGKGHYNKHVHMPAHILPHNHHVAPPVVISRNVVHKPLLISDIFFIVAIVSFANAICKLFSSAFNAIFGSKLENANATPLAMHTFSATKIKP